MKIKNIKYTEEFNYHGASQWIGMKAEIIEGDDERQSLYELQKKIRGFFYESSGYAEKQKEYHPELDRVSEDKQKSQTPEQKIINQINEITDIKVLESFALIAKNNEEIRQAYDKQLLKLDTKP